MEKKQMSILIILMLGLLLLSSCSNAYKDFNNKTKDFISENNDYFIATNKALILPDKTKISYKESFRNVFKKNDIKENKEIVEFQYEFIENHLFILGKEKNAFLKRNKKPNYYLLGINLDTSEETFYNSFKKEKINFLKKENKLYLYQHYEQFLSEYKVVNKEVSGKKVEFPIIKEDYYFKEGEDYFYRLTENDKLIDAFNYKTLQFENDVSVESYYRSPKKVHIGEDVYNLDIHHINIDLYLNEELLKSFDIYSLYETSNVGQQILDLTGKDHHYLEIIIRNDVVNNEFILNIYYQKGFLMGKGLLGESYNLVFKFDYIDEIIEYIGAYETDFKMHYV